MLSVLVTLISVMAMVATTSIEGKEVVAASSSQQATLKQPPRPNIILLMADDLGYGDVGFNGGAIPTPHIDAMARDGVVLERFYAVGVVCSPTRGSVLTGRNPYRLGIPSANEGYLPPRETTLAELIRPLGYATGFFGKWHVGVFTRNPSERDSNRGGKGANTPQRLLQLPSEHGFDVYVATEAKVPTMDPYALPTHFFPGESKGNGWDVRRTRNGKPAPSQFYGTRYWSNIAEMQYDSAGDVITHGGTGNNSAASSSTGNYAIFEPRPSGDDSAYVMNHLNAFVRQSVAASKPFLALGWFHAPHLPVVSGPPWTDGYENETPYARNYYGCVRALDHQVGRLRALLQELGVADTTLVAFTSDNGPEGKSGDPGSAGPFRGRKRDVTEGGVRVPGVFVWPGGALRPGTRSTFPGATTDYFPTIADMLDIPLPNHDRIIDGVSLLPAMRSAAVDNEGGSNHDDNPHHQQGDHFEARKAAAELKMPSDDKSPPTTTTSTTTTTTISSGGGDDALEPQRLRSIAMRYKDNMALVRGRYKLIVTYRRGKAGRMLFEPKLLRLFDLQTDPREKSPLKSGGKNGDKYEALRQSMWAEINQWNIGLYGARARWHCQTKEGLYDSAICGGDGTGCSVAENSGSKTQSVGAICCLAGGNNGEGSVCKRDSSRHVSDIFCAGACEFPMWDPSLWCSDDVTPLLPGLDTTTHTSFYTTTSQVSTTQVTQSVTEEQHHSSSFPPLSSSPSSRTISSLPTRDTAIATTLFPTTTSTTTAMAPTTATAAAKTTVATSPVVVTTAQVTEATACQKHRNCPPSQYCSAKLLVCRECSVCAVCGDAYKQRCPKKCLTATFDGIKTALTCPRHDTIDSSMATTTLFLPTPTETTSTSTSIDTDSTTVAVAVVPGAKWYCSRGSKPGFYLSRCKNKASLRCRETICCAGKGSKCRAKDLMPAGACASAPPSHCTVRV